MADDNLRIPPFQMTPPPALSEPLATKLPPLPSAKKPADKPAAPAHPKDSFRDVVETIVFVIVLVLLLKTFIAEAFVIPTGSMATTLWGYQKEVKCPQCNYEFPVNCSSQVDPDSAESRAAVIGCTCPNCRYSFNFPSADDPTWHSGDRVLVAKFLYDSQLRHPEREDVVVFKYPKEPQRNHVARNYIKRLVGKPGETIGIYYGNVYVGEGLNYPAPNWKPGDLPPSLREEMFRDKYVEQLERDARRSKEDKNRKFQIIRKAPAQILSMSRIVYDNDSQAKDLVGKVPPRWAGEKDSGWQPDSPDQPRTFQIQAQPGRGVAWLRYSHLLPPDSGWVQSPDVAWQPRLITDFLGYNSGRTSPPISNGESGQNWVGDLMLEGKAKIENAEGELTLELNRGADRFQVRFLIKNGACSLFRNGTQLTSVPSPIDHPGEYRLRFANFDERLTIWVNDELLPGLGDGWDYDPPASLGPTEKDLQPVRIGVRDAKATISELRLFRDTYYTVNTHQSRDAADMGASDWSDPEKFAQKLARLPARTMYVQPGHYLCLGDNSPASSDGRDWGLVPESLMLGRALVIYFPFSRVGLIK